MANFGPVTAEIGSGVWGTSAISTDFASHLRYCSDVAHRRPTKLCTMFGRLLGWYTIIHFRGLLPPDGIFPGQYSLYVQVLRSPVLAALGAYCTALQQRASAKHCGVIQGMELRNFRRGRHLYLAGRPSRWASTHIVVAQVCCARFVNRK